MPNPNWPLLVQLTIHDMRYWWDELKKYDLVIDETSALGGYYKLNADYDPDTFVKTKYSQALNSICNSCGLNYKEMQMLEMSRKKVKIGSVFENRLAMMAFTFSPQKAVLECNIPEALIDRAFMQWIGKVEEKAA